MMTDNKAIWSKLIAGPNPSATLNSIMWRVACGLSNTVGRTISNGASSIETIPLSQVATFAGGPEAEMVAIYLVIQSGIRGQALLILPLHSALHLCDLLLDLQPGSSTNLGEVERSALAEVGNITLSYFLNAVATSCGDPDFLRPSPPAVMVDMLGAMLDVIVTPIAVVRDDMLIIETPFVDSRSSIQARFWVLPDPTFKLDEQPQAAPV
jgi:chemotaxis protein CheC